MYILDDMVDMGLPDGVRWPSEMHRMAAQNILIANPEISNMDDLKKGVLNIINIPSEVLPSLTLDDLPKYGFKVGKVIGV